MFFVSVADKGLSIVVSGLESTLVGHQYTWHTRIVRVVSYCRDRAVQCLFRPSALTRVTLLPALSSSSFFLFLFLGVVLGAGCWGLGNAPSTLSRFIVFSAAPFNSIGRLARTWALLSRYAPPAYVNRDGASTQPSQLIPSNGWMPPSITPPRIMPRRGGTTGSAPATTTPPWPACTHVDVWMSESATNAQQAPTINDPNASATLVITPPSGKKSNCTEWSYYTKK
jgi:hypothetical protein